jgi:CheY-like chemotaxis protein
MDIPLHIHTAPSVAERDPGPLMRPASLRVLVIDDNVDGAEALCAVLSSMGCETAIAFGGAQGLAAAAAFDPDLALIDLEMPDMSGCEVARQLRAPPAHSAARLICLTGRSHPEDQRLCAEAGFDDFYTKPVWPDTLVELVVTAKAAAQRLQRQSG